MNITREIKLGVFVLVTSFAFGFLILTFGEIPLFRPEMNRYVVYFDDVGGLSKGAEVRVSGIRAGRVEEIILEDSKVKVIFSLDKKVKIYRDAVASIGTLGLMGDKYLAIKPGSSGSGTIPPDGVIENSEGVADTDILIKELTRTAENFRLVAENLNRILEENRRNINLALENLSELTKVLGEMAKENRESLRETLTQMAMLTENLNRTLPQALTSIESLADELSGIAKENRGDLRELVANLKDISGSIRGDLPQLVEDLNRLTGNLNHLFEENRDDIRATVRNLSEITDRLKESSRKLDEILERIHSGRGTIGKLVTDDELYESVTKGAKLFGEAGEVITKTRFYVGFGGEYYEGGDTKAFLSLRIQPTRTTYFLIEGVGDSRGRVYTQEILGTGEIIRKEFRPEITLQIAKNFYLTRTSYLTVRAGLKESTGGVGFDVVPAERLRIYSDIWETGRKDRPGEKGLNPILQVGVQLRVWGPLYTRFGGDDLLNEKLRGYFIGAGMEFSEDYLKYLLGGLGLPFP